MRDAKIGDPSLPDTQIGPIATRPQFEKILDYIEIAKAEGAKCVLGGKGRPDLGAGLFIEPTIFTGVSNEMRIAQEEVFGPVLSVIPFEDEADAIRIGNDVAYGLAAAVWTKSLHRAMLLTEKLKAGPCGSITIAPPASRHRLAVTRTQASVASRAPKRSRSTCTRNAFGYRPISTCPTRSCGAELRCTTLAILVIRWKA